MNILIFLAISLAIQLILFIPAFRFKTDKLTDLSYSLTFIILTTIAFLLNSMNFATALLLSMVLLWGFRLGIFLFIRISKTKKDPRFDGVRENFKAFLTFWLGQGVIVFLLLIPVFYFMQVTSGLLSPISYIGLAIFLLGFAFESIADYQKYKFKSQKQNKNKFISHGFWSLSRHPNYFGEILIWIGIYFYALPALNLTETLLSLLSPITIMVILLFFTGIPPLEKKYNKKYKNNKAYQKYKSKTPLLVPFTKIKKIKFKFSND